MRNYKVFFHFNSPSISKYDVFQTFKTFGPLIRCYVKDKESKNPNKTGFIKFRNVSNALRVFKLGKISVKDSFIMILPNPKVNPRLLKLFSPEEVKEEEKESSNFPCVEKGSKVSTDSEENEIQKQYFTSEKASRAYIPRKLLVWDLESENQGTSLKNERLIKIVAIRHRHIDNLRLNYR